MQRARFYIALLMAGLVTTFSCTEIVEIELDSTYDRLVVYGTITTDSLQHEVILTSTTNYFYSDTPPPVEKALVSVTTGDFSYEYEESPDRPGVYISSIAYRGEPGTVYQLEISNVDIDKNGETEFYSASTSMPQIIPADSIAIQKFVTPFFSAHQVALWTGDPPGKNYYSYKLYRNGELINKRLEDFTVQPDDFFNDSYIAGLPVGILSDDDEEEVVVPGDIVTLEINSITGEYYDFVTQAQSEIFGNNPLFSGPPANVSSNLDNGAVGIFTAYSIDRISNIVPPPSFPGI